MSPHRKRSSPTRVNWLLVIIFAVVIFGSFYALSSLGPRSVTGGSEDRVTDQVALELLERSREREERFGELLLEGVVDANDVEVLSEAIALQKRYIAALPARDFMAENRLEKLERRYSEYMGEILAREADFLETRARAETDPREKLSLLQEAIAVREDIRDRYGASSRNDMGYLSKLRRETSTMEIQPIYERSLALEEEGDELTENREFKTAVARYNEAANLQEEINRNYSNLSLAQPRRAARLREKEATVLSGEFRRQIDELIREANDLVYEEKYEEAATAFSRAREMQRNLNLEYPRSPYASRGREERLRVQMQNASAHSSYERLGDLEILLNRSLREENFDEARLLIEQISDRISRFELRYSLSTLPIKPLADRILYLDRKKGLLEQIQAAVESDLRPIPGEPSSLLYATEVPQYLYELVMDANPSRNAGMDLPVETVSLAEAEDFVSRVGWILAREARLPTLGEFKAAAEAVASMQNFEVYSSSSGTNEPQPVESLSADENGYFHLLGNVSEMVILSDAVGDVGSLGGNLRTLEDQMREFIPTKIDPGERNRMVGFRFVVMAEPLSTSLEKDPKI